MFSILGLDLRTGGAADRNFEAATLYTRCSSASSTGLDRLTASTVYGQFAFTFIAPLMTVSTGQPTTPPVALQWRIQTHDPQYRSVDWFNLVD